MNEYGCIQIIEESKENEKTRPLWKKLMLSLGRGDEVVITKFSNKSRSSIFRVLNENNITLNRGKHSGPIKKWSERRNPIINRDKQEKSE